MQVTKRNGETEEFQIDKIIKAVNKAFQAQNVGMPQELAVKIKESFINGDTFSVEEIQDKVEQLLMEERFYDIAKAFILYREKHKEARFIRERIEYMNTYTNPNTNAATASETDANANVTMKNVANLEGEVYKVTNRIIQRQRMKEKLNTLYPNSKLGEQYIEDLEHHIIYTNDEASTPVLKPYCKAVTLYPLLAEGVGNIDGVTPSAPNDIQSFSGQVTNLVFLLSSQCKGAVALGDYFIALNFYVIKEFGEDWYQNIDLIVTNDNSLKTHTVEYYIKKGMKQFIYGINQPAGNRSYNSPFTNVSYYDKYYFESLFDGFYYPDGTQPKWEAIDKLQRMFMQLHRELRLIKPLTFPVSTIALVHNNKEYLDQNYKELAAEEWAKGGSFFCYNSNNPSSLASCCFSKDTKVLWKNSYDGVKCTTLEELHNTKWEPYKKNLKIFHNGSWIKGKSIKLPCRDMYKVITYNNKEFYMTDNHINVTLNGEKSTSELTTNDYLLFNTQVLNRIPENDEGLTYAEGILVGAFLGDGTISGHICQDGSIHSMNYSLNEEKFRKLTPYLDALKEKYNMHYSLNTPYNNVYPVKVTSKEFVAFIIKWSNWVEHTTAISKDLNLNCLLQSADFRKGILDGWYITDGGNSNRCYTVSSKLRDAMEMLITSLGMQSIIDVSDRTDESVIIRGEIYNRNYPLYCIRFYTPTNHRTCKNPEHSWIKRNNSIYFRIKSIEKVPYEDSVYCIECGDTNEPYFTLPSGLITHNCRVLNEMSDNTFSSTTGMTGIMTGSCNVITLNLNRITQDYFRTVDTNYFGASGILYQDITEEDMQGFREYLIKILERVYKYHIAYKTMLYDMEDAGMFSDCNAGYIYIKKLYSTIGLLGYVEAAKYLGLEISNNQYYKQFLQTIFGTVKEQNKLHSINDKNRPYLFNSEAIPGENLAVKLYNWDKQDAYKVPENQNLYDCYFFNPWDDTSVLDKFKLHGKEIAKYCDGGQACHVNLDSHLSKEQYLKLLDFAMEHGTNYFTFNIPVSECKDCGHVVNAPIKECPKCHSTNIDYWIRIIGYLRPVSAFSAPRQVEAHKRTFSDEVR